MSRILVLFSSYVLLSQPSYAKVSVKLEEQPIAVKTAKYEARIEPDGCLTQLKLGGINYFAPGVSVSRGSYFYQNGPLKLRNLKRMDDDIVVANSEQASIRYEFDDDRLTAHVTNASDTDMVFFVVLNGLVSVGRLAAGELQPTPLLGKHTQASFFIDKHRLEITGFDRLWGPWQGPHQVVETALKPDESRTLTFQAFESNEAERLKILSYKSAPAEADLTISSPREYQVIQRDSKTSGRVLVSGRTQIDASTIKLRVVGNSIADDLNASHSIAINTDTHKFSQWLVMPAGGWYRLEARALTGDKVIAEAAVEHFGIGEVFVGAGQSNSTNCGQFKTTQTSGMVSSFSGKHWQIADDPQPGVADRSQGGSFWPAFGDKMFDKLGVPIGVATTGYGGTSVNQWQPDGDLFQRWMMQRIHQLGPDGFRAVLWHQGESDVHMPSDEYYAKLKNTILSSVKHAGWEFPWFVAQASYHNAENSKYASVRNAQKRLWEEGIAQPGPDTDTLTGDHRDFKGKGIHFSPKGLKVHGEMWAEKVIPYVRTQLSIQSNAKAQQSN